MRRSRIPYAALALAAVLPQALPAAAADRYPVRPVRLVVPYAPGGGSDITARAIGQKLGEALGQTFVVDNRPGAASMIATELVAKAPADGYTLILSDVPHTVNAVVYRERRYDPIKDFTPVALLATTPLAMTAHPSFVVGSMKELIALPKAQTEKFALGTSGQGSGPHMTYEWLRTKTGLTLNHVPYKGGGPALADLVAGQIPLVLNAIPAAVPHLQAKRLKGLGLTAATRHPLFPDMPTFVDAGVQDFVVMQWYGVLAPAGTPKETITLLNAQIRKALDQPDMKERFAALALDIDKGSREDFVKLIATEYQRWAAVAKQTGIKMD